MMRHEQELPHDTTDRQEERNGQVDGAAKIARHHVPRDLFGCFKNLERLPYSFNGNQSAAAAGVFR